MRIQATTLDAYNLLHEGCLALSQVEANGIRIDEKYLQQAIADTKTKIRVLSDELTSDKIYKVWKKRFGLKMNIDSGDQLGKILFGEMGYKCPSLTSSGKPKTDISVLESLDIDFVKKLLQIKKLKKAVGTYLKGIQKETCNGFLHPVFNLHLVETFRSSSDSPNFQNQPVRNPEMAKLIRTCFIPREDRHIIEVDFSGAEIHAAAWYHKDPVMQTYLNDKTKDMHRDLAQQCYMLSDEEMCPIDGDKADAKRIKNIRYCGKNKFVFPQFYGDWFMNCAPSLWAAIDQMKLQTRDGLSLKEHLKKKGITQLGVIDPKSRPSPGTFVNHIKEVEFDFWNNRFAKYKEWKDKWWEKYQRTGQFTTLTGFVISGLYKRNEVINYPVQGVAFHCLLWSLIRLQKQLRKYKMKSLIVGQIHDSIVADVCKDEVKDYLTMVKQIMTEDIKKHWTWINTPLEVEAEMSPLNRSWYEKTKVEM